MSYAEDKLALAKRLDDIEAQIDKDLERMIHDSHDYSSSAYSGVDDGFNQGVAEATDMFKRAVLEMADEYTWLRSIDP